MKDKKNVDTLDNDIEKLHEKREEKRENFSSDIRRTILYFISVIIGVLFIHAFIGHQVTVEGSSMEKTLHNEDRLLLEKVTYRFGKPKRYDIVVFRPYSTQKDTYYIKRVIGLPGETVLIKDGDIYIDGELLDEHFGTQEMADGGLAKEIIKLGKEEYFLLGDNRNNSMDSRSERIGPVHKDTILGRAFVRIWPIQGFGSLKE